MDVLILLVFVSLLLVVGALLFLLTRVKGGDFEHVDRLPFLPLEPEPGESPAPGAASRPSPGSSADGRAERSAAGEGSVVIPPPPAPAPNHGS